MNIKYGSIILRNSWSSSLFFAVIVKKITKGLVT